MRFDDSPDLFGRGIGQASSRPLHCDWCGTDYKGDPDGDMCIKVTDFGGKQICECCFEIIEKEIIERMGDILSWFVVILGQGKARLDNRIGKMREIERRFGNEIAGLDKI